MTNKEIMEGTIEWLEGLGWKFIGDGKGGGSFFKESDYEELKKTNAEQCLDYVSAQTMYTSKLGVRI